MNATNFEQKNTPVMFILKSYTRKELALLYFPDSRPKSAYQNLRRWLLQQAHHKDLLQRIRHRRILRKVDVQEIVAILGEP